MKKQSISKVEQLNNLKQQVIDLKVANKDKAETIQAMKKELLEYSELRDRFKVLYEENNKLKKENLELKDKIQVLEQSVKDTYDTSQEIIVELQEEKEKWRKLCLCWREAYIECDEKFHNLCKEVLKDDSSNRI